MGTDLPRDMPVVVLFSDDSTLFFALRTRELLRRADPERPVELHWYIDETALSYRQMTQLLPEGPARALKRRDLQDLAQHPYVAGIVTCRPYGALAGQTRNQTFRLSTERPCLTAFLGGLDFFPEQGFSRRRNYDSVFLFPQDALETYQEMAIEWDQGWQNVDFGHPSFTTPAPPPADLADRRDIYFFAQALSPLTVRGRKHMVRALAAMARRYPDRTIYIKLRHLPHENRSHLHLEKHDYPGVLHALGGLAENDGVLPENLKITACTMDEALETAALGITCTSTAAIDCVRAGIPTMVHLDFVDNYRDSLVDPMRALFEQSGLITSLQDMLDLRSTAPDPAWVDRMFCPDDLGERMLDSMARFRNRPFQIVPPQA